jgi:hypothetical protein
MREAFALLFAGLAEMLLAERAKNAQSEASTAQD